MDCPQCKADNSEGKNFCSDCGSLLTPQLKPLVRSQVEEYIQEHFKDQKVVDIETSEAIAERFLKWGKWFLIPATILLTLIGLVFALLGFSDYSHFHQTVQRAIEELKPKLDRALSEADTATKKAQDAGGKSEEAVKSINAATAKLNAQVASAQQLLGEGPRQLSSVPVL